MEPITVKNAIKYFFRGLLFVVPLALTLYIIIVSMRWVDGLIPIESIPGLGLIIIVVAITVFGYLGSFFITKPIFVRLERYISRVPLANILYTSIQDLIGAFVGDKKKFNRPVMVKLDEHGKLYKLGFITQTDLSALDLPEMVSVYLPHSYNFSGNHFIFNKENIQPLNIGGASAMKFIVSGGVSGLEE